jgi:hypothetical protein
MASAADLGRSIRFSSDLALEPWLGVLLQSPAVEPSSFSSAERRRDSCCLCVRSRPLAHSPSPRLHLSISKPLVAITASNNSRLTATTRTALLAMDAAPTGRVKRKQQGNKQKTLPCPHCQRLFARLVSRPQQLQRHNPSATPVSPIPPSARRLPDQSTDRHTGTSPAPHSYAHQGEAICL